ncbi:triose-phosphate isomerase [Jiella sp. M17.18]|uniref:triose-phosphate isomerase n=1 Tax=Jiella sp. M17.18 TaxID=3234247 RepID=UPI0034DFD1DE
MAPRPLIAGNWKMNGSLKSLVELKPIAEAAERLRPRCDVLICPPATILSASHGILGSAAAVGGQDCHAEASGAHTGDVAAEMLADLGARFVIVGHSERRTDHDESDAVVRAKAEAASRAGLTAIVCVGESEEERKAGRALDVLRAQLAGSVPEGATPDNLVVAYEPLWAIGSGRTATSADVAEAHALIRSELSDRFGPAGVAGIRILYGGSVNPDNAAGLLAIDNVDGALVGGCSLKAETFIAICEAVPDLREPASAA